MDRLVFLRLLGAGLALCLGVIGTKAFAADPKFAYVANSVSGTVSVYKVDKTSGALTPRTAVLAGSYPISVTVDPSGRFVYVANHYSDNVSVYTINQTTGALTPGTAVAAGISPSSVTVAPSGRFAYVANSRSDNVSVYAIDQTTGALTASSAVAAGSYPVSVAIDPSGRFAYVTNRRSDNVSVYTVNQATGALTAGANVATETSPESVAIDSFGRFAYVANHYSDNVLPYTIDQTTGALTDDIGAAAGISPTSVTVDPSGRFAYVTSSGYSNTLWADSKVLVYTIDQTTGALTTGTAVAAGLYPISITVDPSGRFAYVANYYSDNVSVYTIDQITGALTAGTTVASGISPISVAITAGATSSTVLEMPWFTKLRGYISRFILLNTGSSAASFNISILTEAGNSAVINPAYSSGSIPANTQYVINVDDLIQRFNVGQRAAVIFTSSATPGTLSGIYNLVQPNTGAVSNVSLLRGQDFSSSSSALLAPWISTSTGYASAFIFSNAGSTDATATVSFLAPSGTSVSTLLSSLTVPAQGQLVVDTSAMVTLQGGTIAAAVFSFNAPEGYIKGVYKIVNTTSGTTSSTELVSPQSSSGSTTRLVTPWFSITSGYSSFFSLTNRGSTAASYSVTVVTELGNTATTGSLSGSIPASGQILLPASSIVSGFTGATRASAIFDVNGSPASIDGAYGIVSLGTGAISTNILSRGDTSGSLTTTLKLPWFSGAAGYVSRFVLLNRGSIDAPFTIQILPEAGNSVTQIRMGGTIPARGQLVLPVEDVVTGFTTTTRAAAVFTISAPAADIDGLYNIVNPTSGTISNTMMGR